MAELEGGAGAVATCSGLAAATTAILAMARAGDHILVCDSAYGGTRRFCDSLGRSGIHVEYYDPRIGADIAALIRPQTTLVYLESPGSVTLEVQDIPAIVGVCRAAGVFTICDSTWATPLFCQPIGLGVDVVVHSASKYINGYADSLLGVIVCSEATLEAVRTCAIGLGQCPGPDDVYLGLRGLRTLDVRLRQHERQALEVARWLTTQPEIDAVLHPALPSHPDHELWQRDFTGSTGLFSVVLPSALERDHLAAAVETFRIFRLGHGWGGFESLVSMEDPRRSRSTPRWKGGAVLRLHIGLEAAQDLIDDLAAGLALLR